jgi:alpha-glucosidase
MTNWTERTLTIDLSRLGLSIYDLEGITDGINANEYASDYQWIKKSGLSDQTFTLHLAQGGGAALKILPTNPSNF